MALPAALLESFPELATARYRRGGLPLRIGGWALGARSVAGIEEVWGSHVDLNGG